MTMPQTAPAPDSARPQTRSVEVYDFLSPTTLAREHARVLELASETCTLQWATQLTAKVRAKSTAVSLDMQAYDEYAASRPGSTAMVLPILANRRAKPSPSPKWRHVAAAQVSCRLQQNRPLSSVEPHRGPYDY